MDKFKKNSVKATIWIYIGFAIGAFNMYLLTANYWFNTEEVGLTRMMLEMGIMLAGFAGLGNTSYFIKFFPYYRNAVSPKQNDMLFIGLLVCILGFLITVAGLVFFKPLVIQKYSTNAPLLVNYFFYLIPLFSFILFYQLLEAYSFGFDKGLFTTILKETILRAYTTILILAYIFFKIPFPIFILLFSLQYALLIALLVINLIKNNQLWLNFKISTLTRRFKPKILSIMAFSYIPVIVSVIRLSIDSLILASVIGLTSLAVVALASYMVAVMQAPFRSVVAITTPVLARAWRDKNLREIEKIYKSSSINLLSFSLFIFFLVWLNYENAVKIFNLPDVYTQGKWVFFVLGLVAIIETGTGVNSQIIATSNYWRFEMYSNIFLTLMIIPLSYYLTNKYGILGPAVGNLVAFFIYNLVRFSFLYRVFNLQPFTSKTLLVVVVALVAYTITYLVTKNLVGWKFILLSSTIYATFFIPLVLRFKISADFNQAWAKVQHTVLRR